MGVALVAAASTTHVCAEELLAQNEAGSGTVRDLWEYRGASSFVGRMTEDSAADEYHYDRVGLYDVAQSFKLNADVRITTIEAFITGSETAKKGVTLSLRVDADGLPSAKLIEENATASIKPVRGQGAFRRFRFRKPIAVKGGTLVWMVFSKPDESSENPLYSVPSSAKDDKGPRDWYLPGTAAHRGPYRENDPFNPAKWKVSKGRDAYFKIFGSKAKVMPRARKKQTAPSPLGPPSRDIDPRFSDDFGDLENVDVMESLGRRRDFPRIVRRPDVRINRTNPAEYKDSRTGKGVGYGYFPLILRLANGELMAFWREGSEHGMKDYECRAVLARSKDGGRTWGQAEVIKEMEGWGVSDDVGVAESADGSIWLTVRQRKVAPPGKGQWKMATLRSSDGGHTWEEVSDTYGMAPMIAMSNGEILWQSWGTPEKSWYSWRMTYATKGLTDGKIHWGKGRYHPELGSSDEWSATETKTPGELVCILRNQWDGDFFGTARSFDYGKTWTQWRSSNINIGCCPTRPKIHTMPDGRLIASYGQRWIGRTFAVVSSDNGETWDIKHRQVILHSPREYLYRWDSHYTDIARAEGEMWLGIDYIASPRSREQMGIYGTFIDARYFDDVFLGVTLAEAASPVTDKTVGWWRFDETKGDFARDTVGSNYGEVHGAKRVPGNVGPALAFDGRDDYVMIYDDTTLQVPNCFTVEARINTTDATKEQTIMSKAPAYTLLLRQGKPVLEIGPYRMTADMKAPLASNRWHHIMVVYGLRPNYPKATFLIDGEEISYTKPKYSLITSYQEALRLTDKRIADGPMFQGAGAAKIKDTECLVIGMDNDLKGRPFHGVIDEVVLHGVDLNEKIAKNPAPRGYPERGRVTSRVIARPEGSAWTTFKARTTAPEGTTVRFAILDAQGKTLVDDIAPGANLSGVRAEEISLQAVLQTTRPGQTPILWQWSVATDADKPAVKKKPFPDQCAPLAHDASKIRASGPRKKVAPPEIDPGAIELRPVSGLPVELYGQPVGTKAMLVFNVDEDPASIDAAWLVMTVDDIDEAREAKLTLNGKPVIVHDSLLGEGITTGTLVVPVDALVKGRNVFEFVFADNLGGTTEGFQISEAILALKKSHEIPL